MYATKPDVSPGGMSGFLATQAIGLRFATRSVKICRDKVLIRIRALFPTRYPMRGTGFDERKAQRALKSLEEAGLLRRVGSGRATRFEIAH